MPTQSSSKRVSRVQPVTPFLYHAGSNDPTNNHQDEKLVMVYTDSWRGLLTHLIRWHQPGVPVGDVCTPVQCNYHEGREKTSWDIRTPFTGILQDAVSPHGCLPLTRFDHFRKLHKPRHISGKCFTLYEYCN
jgi:hypothetical protein